MAQQISLGMGLKSYLISKKNKQKHPGFIPNNQLV